MVHSVSDLAALLRLRQPGVVLTGAGISTESGIPDFRSPGGIWGKYDPVAGLPVETISTGGALAIVNRGRTPFDHLASIRIEAGAGETLSTLAGSV